MEQTSPLYFLSKIALQKGHLILFSSLLISFNLLAHIFSINNAEFKIYSENSILIALLPFYSQTCKSF